MNIPPLVQTQVTPATHTAATMPNNAQGPAGMPGDTMTSASPAPEGRCSWLREGFSTLINKFKDLFEWIKSCFGCSRQQDSSNPANNPPDNANNQAPTNNTEPAPVVNQPVIPVINQPVVPVINQPVIPVINQPVVPVANHLLIRQMFGQEIVWKIGTLKLAFDLIQARPQDEVERIHQAIRERMVTMFETLPDMVKLHIKNRMEELKREDNPGVVLVNNWADRVIRGEGRLAEEVEAIATVGEMSVIGANGLFVRAIEDLHQQLGAPAQGERMPVTLTFTKILICFADAALLLHPNDRIRVRGDFVEHFNRFPQDIQNRIKNRMVEIARGQALQVDGINDWAGRVIRGEVRIEGEAADVQLIEAHINILAPASVFHRAIDGEIMLDLIRERHDRWVANA